MVIQDGRARSVSAWAEHLRDGGTTTWSAWPRDAAPAAVWPDPLPDATRLELLRRLNLSARLARPARTAGAGGLADLVLTTPAPGRGPVDMPLPWPGAPPRFGTRPVDPELLSAEDLVRLAVGVLARLLPGVRLPDAATVAPPPGRWPLPWRPRFLLHGTPDTARAVRRSLLAAGLVESDWRPTHVVVARPLEVMMAEHWAARNRAGGILKWSTLWRRSMAAGRLPGAVDTATTADRLLARGDGPVHVVLARDADPAAQLVAHVLGLRSAPVPALSPPDLSAADLVRRVNRLTGLQAGPARVPELAARLTEVLAGAALGEEPLAGPRVPRPALDWARGAAAAQADRLRCADYAVHGAPADLAPDDHQGTGRVDRDRTLELALRACLASWQLQEGQDPT